jgi:hypothetical protein
MEEVQSRHFINFRTRSVPLPCSRSPKFCVGSCGCCTTLPVPYRSLFTKDKLLFSFLMTCHLKAHITKTLDLAQLRFLLTGETPLTPLSRGAMLHLWGGTCRG